MKKTGSILCMLTCCICLGVKAQNFKDAKLSFNADGTNYLKMTLLAQTWGRYQHYNPGTTIFGYPKSSGFDIGIRRFRWQMIGQLTDRILIYTQVGENNFNNISDRKFGFFVHDAYGEYAVVKEKLSIGGGLSGWSGLARFASPAAGSIMGLDAPLFEQSTNDATDQFLRKLSLHLKGKLGRLDYRLSLSEPMSIQKSSLFTTVVGSNASFSNRPPKMQTNAYIMWQMRDKEANLTPYTTGTYLGKKNVMNLGAGLVYQPSAMWYTGKTSSDTITHHMLQAAVDFFYDVPIKSKGASLSAYAVAAYFDFGKNYIRNIGVMNPANGNNRQDILNGGGNAFPMIGTGTVFYAQAGYKFKDESIGKITLMPYMAIEHANFERLRKPADFLDIGINWLLKGHTSKLTTVYQNRPIYLTNGDLTTRKSAFIVQYQVFLN